MPVNIRDGANRHDYYMRAGSSVGLYLQYTLRASVYYVYCDRTGLPSDLRLLRQVERRRPLRLVLYALMSVADLRLQQQARIDSERLQSADKPRNLGSGYAHLLLNLAIT